MTFFQVEITFCFVVFSFQRNEQFVLIDVLESAADVVAQAAPGKRRRRPTARPQHLPDSGEQIILFFLRGSISGK